MNSNNDFLKNSQFELGILIKMNVWYIFCVSTEFPPLHSPESKDIDSAGIDTRICSGLFLNNIVFVFDAESPLLLCFMSF